MIDSCLVNLTWIYSNATTSSQRDDHSIFAQDNAGHTQFSRQTSCRIIILFHAMFYEWLWVGWYAQIRLVIRQTQLQDYNSVFYALLCLRQSKFWSIEQMRIFMLTFSPKFIYPSFYFIIFMGLTIELVWIKLHQDPEWWRRDQSWRHL